MSLQANEDCQHPSEATCVCKDVGQPPLAPAHGSASRQRLKAKMDGACAALEGRKLDANKYPEDSELHFDWLDGWTSAKLEMRKTPNESR